MSGIQMNPVFKCSVFGWLLYSNIKLVCYSDPLKLLFLQDEGSRGSAAVVPEMISRSSSSHEVSVSVSGRGQSPEPEVTQSIPEASMARLEQQQQVPIGSVAIVRKHIFQLRPEYHRVAKSGNISLVVSLGMSVDRV